MIGKDTTSIHVYVKKKVKKTFEKKAKQNGQKMSERVAELIIKDITS
jgi:hypothetical protein